MNIMHGMYGITVMLQVITRRHYLGHRLPSGAWRCSEVLCLMVVIDIYICAVSYMVCGWYHGWRVISRVLCDRNIDTIEGFMQKIGIYIYINELYTCECFCASVMQTAHTTMSVTRMNTFVISKYSESLGYNTGDEH